MDFSDVVSWVDKHSPKHSDSIEVTLWSWAIALVSIHSDMCLKIRGGLQTDELSHCLLTSGVDYLRFSLRGKFSF